nr:beta-glucosidase 24-like [Tanacetum cinerariifolium]
MTCQAVGYFGDINAGDFDVDFVWGAATSAYQIEGAASEGRIVGGDNGNNAVYAYYKTKEDMQTIKKMGLNAITMLTVCHSLALGHAQCPARFDFVNYAELCFWEFGDRVKHWITLNEPQSYCVDGHGRGSVAPGRGGEGDPGDPATEPYIVARNLILSHANVVALYRQRFQVSQGGKIGITLGTKFLDPLNAELQDDIDAALRGLDF